jgi:superfamily I DNA and/or RNA helicase
MLSTIKLIKPIPENNVMRFGDQNLINFVNNVIPFEKYGLPPIQKNVNYKDHGLKSDLVIFPGSTIYATDTDKNKINTEVQNIMKYYRQEVELNNCKPNDFLIVTPFTKQNPLIETLNLEIRN